MNGLENTGDILSFQKLKDKSGIYLKLREYFLDLLMKEGEKWMKETTSCRVADIVTIMFSTPFVVPIVVRTSN